MAIQFDHIGIVTTEKKADEIFVAATRVWVTDFRTHPFHVEWLRFEPDSPVTGPVRDDSTAAASRATAARDSSGRIRSGGRPALTQSAK